MCGLIASFNKNSNANQFIVDQYQDQYSRGQKGFGSLFINDDGSFHIERATEPYKALLDLYMNESNMIIMHHRTPTSTDNYLDQTHPIKVSNKELKHNYYVIHNGVISNDDDLKKSHNKIGYRYTTAYKTTADTDKFNDSEALAIEVARFIEKKTKKVGATGSAAFIAAQVDKKTNKIKQIFFGRNGFNPLQIKQTKSYINLSSEGEGEEVEENKLFYFNPKEMKIKSRKMPFKEREYSTSTSYLTAGYNNSHSYWNKGKNKWEKDKKSKNKKESSYYDDLDDEFNDIVGFSSISTPIEYDKDYDFNQEIEDITDDLSTLVTAHLDSFIDEMKDEQEIWALQMKDLMSPIAKEVKDAVSRIQDLRQEEALANSDTK